MWSKVRKKLIEMLPNCLKGKIDFQMTAYRFGWRSMDKGHQCPTITIIYDKEIVLRTYQNVDYLKEHYKDKYDEKLHYDTYHFFNAFIEYIGMKHEVARTINNYYIRLFTLLDKRTGKRTLENIKEGYYECKVKELRRIYEIRFNEEHIFLKNIKN